MLDRQHAELDAHRITPLGPEGPRGIGDDGPMTAMVFERLQFGIMMLLSQGISYWDAPGLLAAQWTDPQQGKKNTEMGEVPPSQVGSGAHIAPSLHSSTFRASDGVGLGFELASPSARLSMSGKAGIDLRRGSLADSESSDYMPVPETVAGAFAAGYRREALGEEASTAAEQRAVGKPPMPTPPKRDPNAAPEASPRRTGGAGRMLTAADGPSWQPEESPTYSGGPVGSGRDAAVGRGSKAKVHDPNRLALYQHESSSYGLEIRLAKSEQWRANQERPSFRTCFQMWGYAKAMQLVGSSSSATGATGRAMVNGMATRRRTPLENSKRTTARRGSGRAEPTGEVSVL